ncbi:hypothetical protein ES705_49085 [subsurface metagenome]
MKRLSLRGDKLGVEPWDDGSLKLAVEAAFGEAASKTAVSNAVQWSQRGDSGQNINPDEKLKTLSSQLWNELFDILNPRLVICSGNVADSVIKKTKWEAKKTLFLL